MKVYNQEKTQELTYYDLTKGYLKNDKLFIKHHPAQSEIKEQYHYETIKTYSNGGKDVMKVVDVEGVPYRDAYDEYADIMVYVPYNQQELNSQRIADLRDYLNNEWSWKWERYNAELIEIELGLRYVTTQTKEELITLRKNAVDEINALGG